MTDDPSEIAFGFHGVKISRGKQRTDDRGQRTGNSWQPGEDGSFNCGFRFFNFEIRNLLYALCSMPYAQIRNKE
jgi:hypothetical protein